MSTHYNLEPPPTATVLLLTTAGPITLSLFAAQTPLTCRNFLQHCLDGTYDGLPFHRVAKGFVIQTGDPGATGEGGQNIYDDPEFERLDEQWARLLGREVGEKVVLKDEVHSRLKFGRRGLLGMAKDAQGGYGSQWFVTLGDVGRELDGRCTMFGRVEGEGIYSVVRIAEGEVLEGSERPVYPEKVTKVEVLEMPRGEEWEAMKARVRVAQRSVEERETKVKKPVKKGKKAKAVLSFGDEEEGDVVVKPKKAKFNTALIDGPATENTPKANGSTKQSAAALSRKRSPSPQSTIPAKRKASTASDLPSPIHHRKPSSPDPSTQLPLRNPEAPSRSPTASDSRTHSPHPPHRRPSATKSKAILESEIAALKASMRRPTANTIGDISRKQSALEALIPSTSTRGRKRPRPGETSKEDAKALKMLSAFRSRLEAAGGDGDGDGSFGAAGKNDKGKKTEKRRKDGNAMNGTASEAGRVVPTESTVTANADADEGDEEAKLCDLHFIANCQSCFAAEAAERGGAGGAGGAGGGAGLGAQGSGNNDEDDNDRTFLSHSLNFAMDMLGKDLEWRKKDRNRVLKDGENHDDDGGLVVIDPRAKAREIKEGKGKGGGRGRDRERARAGAGGREWDRGRR